MHLIRKTSWRCGNSAFCTKVLSQLMSTDTLTSLTFKNTITTSLEKWSGPGFTACCPQRDFIHMSALPLEMSQLLQVKYFTPLFLPLYFANSRGKGSLPLHSITGLFCLQVYLPPIQLLHLPCRSNLHPIPAPSSAHVFPCLCYKVGLPRTTTSSKAAGCIGKPTVSFVQSGRVDRPV